jgi:putative phosphoribosyl transferase
MTVETLATRDYFVPAPEARVTLSAQVCLPTNVQGIVVLCGKEASRCDFSRLADVAACLCRTGLGTLSIDLLTASEQRDCGHAACLRANVALLAYRLACVTDWLRTCEHTRGLPIGYFGSDIGSAIALAAAAQRPADVEAIVSYSGRPVLVLPILAQVRTPTLLITAASDPAMIKLHHIAMAQLNCRHSVAILTGPEDLLGHPAAMAQVARLACDWFDRYLSRRA